VPASPIQKPQNSKLGSAKAIVAKTKFLLAIDLNCSLIQDEKVWKIFLALSVKWKLEVYKHQEVGWI
jgi:hypothetical protein